MSMLGYFDVLTVTVARNLLERLRKKELEFDDANYSCFETL